MKIETIPSAAPATAHVFSVDVEEHFQVSAFERVAPREHWDRHPSRVVESTRRLLELLARHGATGTFFTLGWVARRHPALVRAIADAGHEVASHGDLHRRITTLTPREFLDDLRVARDALEQAGGQPVVGFRAPSFSIVPGGEWAFDMLLEAGYRYDSSLFPIARKGYGYPASPSDPFWIVRDGGRLLELPLATTRLLGMRVPAAGGGYLRQFPFAVIRRAFTEPAPAARMFYVHPWEVDPGQPRLDAPLLTRVRHYRGLAGVLPAIDRLLALRPFRSVADVHGHLLAPVPSLSPAPLRAVVAS